ncbi:MAG: YdbL family protein [Alphaproteobacteria bacterium]
MSLRIGIASLVLAAAMAAPALAQDNLAETLRASGAAGEQTDGYLGVVSGGADVKARVDQVNIQRKAFYTDLAGKRGVSVQDVAESTACTLLSTKVGSGQFYKDDSGAWQKNTGGVSLPARCPK